MTDNTDEPLKRIALLLERLSAIELPTEARHIVADLRALCGDLGAEASDGQPVDIDPAALDHILGLVGPRDARTLLDRLHLDLTLCRDALRDGVVTLQWDSLRLAAHNLVSLSGTAGAEPLRQDAVALVATCDRQDRASLKTDVAQVMPPLERLLGHLDKKSAQHAGDTP